MNIQLISSILSQVWAIDEQSSLSYAPLLNNLLGATGFKVDFDFKKETFQPFAIDRKTSEFSYHAGWGFAQKGSIAVIPLRGPLMKDSQSCGPVGMEELGQRILEADNHPNIDGILLKIDSPGGTVDGTETLANIIKDTNKPIIAFADGLMASAALWLGSAADEVIAAGNKTKIGSVGVILSMQDVQPAFEKLGVVFHSIVASQSKDKTKMYDEVREGNYETLKKDVLDPLAADFIDTIKANRPGVTDDLLTGQVYFAENVLGKFVDSIGSFQSTIARLNELIDNSDESHSSNNPQKTPTMEFTAINKVLGLDANPESGAEGTFLNDEQMALLNAALQSSVDQSAAVTAAQKQRDDNKTALDAANAEIATLKGAAGDETATVIIKKDAIVPGEDHNVASDKKDFYANMETVGEEYFG